jgi:sirohydrochlorin ferrochelatase
MATALLLIAHGSRRAQANQDLDYVAREISTRRDEFVHIQTSYLELAEPTIQQGGRLCVESGATDVVMVPYFLSPGVHVMDDLIEIRDELSNSYPDANFKLAAPLGQHEKLIDVVLERIDNANRLDIA